MKFRFVTATAAIVALSVPGMASADDKLKYENLVHCAATNIVVSGFLSFNDGETKNKTQIEAFNSQAAALMSIAAVGSNKATKLVQADVSKETDMIVAVLGDNNKSKTFIDTEVPKCDMMGQAAIEVINQVKAAK